MSTTCSMDTLEFALWSNWVFCDEILRSKFSLTILTMKNYDFVYSYGGKLVKKS